METIINKIATHPIVPVYYNDDLEKCKQVLKMCYEGGVRVFEFVNRGVFSKEHFRELLLFKNQYFNDVILGVGTVKKVDEARHFVSIGAEFLISPIFDNNLANYALANNILWIPGCMTPSEIGQAESIGLNLVKLFPGDVLGVHFLKAIKPVFPQMKFMVTGGVSLSEPSLKQWIEQGVMAVGVGSKLFEGEFVDSHNVTENLKRSFDFIDQLKSNVSTT